MVGTKLDMDRTEDFPQKTANWEVWARTSVDRKSIETNSIKKKKKNDVPHNNSLKRQNIFFRFSYFHSLFDLIVDYTRSTLVNERPARGSMVVFFLNVSEF